MTARNFRAAKAAGGRRRTVGVFVAQVNSGEHTRPRVSVFAPRSNTLLKFAMAGAPSPAREARALPQAAKLRVER